MVEGLHELHPPSERVHGGTERKNPPQCRDVPPHFENLTLRMFARLGCLFVLTPLVELALLVQVGRWIGVLPTVGIVAITGLLGATLARREGVRALMRVQMELASGRIPTGAILDGASIVMGGLLLLTPGILSDVLGFALLLPPTRTLLQGWAMARLMKGLERGTIRVAQTHFGFGVHTPDMPHSDMPHSGPQTPPPGSRAPDDMDRPPRPGEILR
jgi:UPF0716 protein FxsA